MNGFELLRKLDREGTADRPFIKFWERTERSGGVRRISCSFAPEFLVQIFDVETHGNYIE